MIPQTFQWSDGPRPNPTEIENYVAFSDRIKLDLDILQLEDPSNAHRWSDDILVETCVELQRLGIKPYWMLWAKTDPDYCLQQIEYLDRLYERFIPGGVQFDAEEQFSENGPWTECAQILNDGLKYLNDKLMAQKLGKQCFSMRKKRRESRRHRKEEPMN